MIDVLKMLTNCQNIVEINLVFDYS